MALSFIALPVAQVGEFYSIDLTQYITGGTPPYVILAAAIGIAPNTNQSFAYDSTTTSISGLPAVSEVEKITNVHVQDSSPTPLTAVLHANFSVGASTAQPYLALITAEHNQQPNFMAVVQALCAGVADTTALIQSMPAAFNLFTAQGAQLDIVGQWIGQGRVIPEVITIPYFGFCELPLSAPYYPTAGTPDSSNIHTFGELLNPPINGGARFYDLSDATAYYSSSILSDPEYLTVLEAVIGRNQSNGTVFDIEQALAYIFGPGCQVIDKGTYNITVSIPAAAATAVDYALITTLDILPRPAGVAINVTTH